MVVDTKRLAGECRNCGSTRKNEGYEDTEYCSGKCEKMDGMPVAVGDVVRPPAKPGFPAGTTVAEMKPGRVEIVPPIPGSFDDYCARPEKYHRRLDADKLNWGVHLDLKQLRQAGLRANRVPIPGDWDFEALRTPEEVDKLREEQGKQVEKAKVAEKAKNG